MNDALRCYIAEMVAQILSETPRVPVQLVADQGKKEKKQSSHVKNTDEDSVDEMSTVAGSLAPGGGFTGPLGLSSEDLKGPGAGKKIKKNRKAFARWK